MSQRFSRSANGQAGRLPWLTVASWLSLVIAFAVGLVWQQPNYQGLLQQAFPQGKLTRIEGAQGDQYRLEQQGETTLVSLAESQGYGGPMSVAVTIGANGRIVATHLLQHKETPGYIFRFNEGKYYRQFSGQPVNHNFRLGDDIDALSGATLTSRGLATAVRQAAHNSVDHFGLPESWQEPGFDAGIKELLAALLFAAALMNKRLPRQHQKRFNQALSVASVGLIGYWLNSALSIALIGSLLLGYLPSPQQHLLWYIMLVGTLGAILFLGRNVYCSQLCPFHQIQRWLHRLSGMNLALYPWLKQRIKWLTNGLLWLSLMLIFLSRTPAIGSYEPFSMLFSLDGLGVQWYILPLSLFGAFLVSDFWCKLLCPLGRFLSYGLELRARTLQKVKKRQRIAIKEVGHESPVK
ncbi:FMN-binding protein [Ferrimonas kyonanensis]|uniref:FMN-binding protein n=1 Tax=Ferrimonas kyonanensis TaxID=364763 RepID=UPI000685ED3B|nr:FMN-binding protein [Ferrimonas kyonanensis]